jgi:hypothetical protein
VSERPTLISTQAQIDRDIAEAQALARIAEVLRDAKLTPVQAIDVLARALAERTKRLSVYDGMAGAWCTEP